MIHVGRVATIREVRAREFRAAVALNDARSYAGYSCAALSVALTWITFASDEDHWSYARLWTMAAELSANAGFYAYQCALLEPQTVVPWVTG